MSSQPVTQSSSIDRTVTLPGRGDLWVRDIPGPTPDAPVVMLLHGLGATARLNWGPSFRPLSRHFRVVALDHRGHGRGLHTRRFRLSECADDAAAAARALGIEQFVAVGYSMGGPVAKLLWRRHPELVTGLVLCATARNFGLRPGRQFIPKVIPAMARVVRLAPGGVRKRMLRGMLARADHPLLRQRVIEELAGHDPAAVMEAAGRVASFSSGDWIGEVDVPTVVIVTTQDDVVPPARQRKLAEAIPGAEVLEVEGDHVVCVAGADRFVPVLVDACRRVAQRAGPAHKEMQ